MHRSLRVALQVALTQQNALLNSMHRSLRVALQVALTQQNALLNSMHRSLRVALQGRVNSAKRSPELNASLPKGRSAGSR
ncbi:hypothetical protein [Leptospira noguchii]|uniref:hypothetical protein n=1 Tax=Leptospira noguchii TaxID=28182 RepID=UPI001FB7B17D|nr:hypothetical protein [Leptospira noguchii]UOG52211.1 hypothetical protein MAL09_16645 [Leptospira noguchii]